MRKEISPAKMSDLRAVALHHEGGREPIHVPTIPKATAGQIVTLIDMVKRRDRLIRKLKRCP